MLNYAVKSLMLKYAVMNLEIMTIYKLQALLISLRLADEEI